MTGADFAELRRLLADAQARVADLGQALDSGQSDRARLCADALVAVLQQVADECDDLTIEAKKLSRPKRLRAR